MRAFLEIVAGPETARRVALAHGEVRTLGRARAADEPFPHDTGMSPIHFAVYFQQGTCWVRDLDSRGGIAVNDRPVTECVLRDGDEVTAGLTRFRVRLEGVDDDALTVPPAAALSVETARDVPDGPLEERVDWVLRRQEEDLYAVLDAARDDAVLPTLFGAGEQYQSLYEGRRGEELAEIAPYLVRLPPDSAFLRELVEAGWGRSWGVYLTSRSSFHEVRRHLRRFLRVQTEEGARLLFRYYDPRVLRLFLPTCTGDEAATFFGPVRFFYIEDDDPGVLVRYARGERGVARTAWELGT